MSDIAAVVAHMRSYKEFCKLLMVEDIAPPNKLIEFSPNNVQRRLLNRIVQAKLDNRPCRLCILKARQMGMSTLLQTIMFHRAMINRGFKARTVAQLDKNAADLFKMTEGFYRNLPESILAFDEFQQRQHRGGNRLYLENDSRLEIDTANNKTAGRGGSAQMLHLSEVAFWTVDAEITALSLMQMVQDNVGTMIALESTPNGMGGFFYDQYLAAKEGTSDFEAVFEPWFEFDLYRRTAQDHHFDGQGNFRYKNDEEIEAHHPDVLERLGRPLSPEQILWRRAKIANTASGEEGFRQEFPRDDMSCFLSSGRPYFTSVLINGWTPKPPVLIGDMEKKPKKSEDGHGPLWLFHPSEAGRKYVAYIDVAGVQSDHQDKARKAGDKEDYSVIYVVRCHDMQTVAVWRDRADPDVVALAAYNLGKYYNKAILCPELPGEGLVVLYKLKDVHKYKNIYQRVILDSRHEPETEKEGWYMTSANRPGILAGLREILRDHVADPAMNADKLCDERLWREMNTFVILGGKPQAKSGSHDDLVMAAAGAMQIALENPQALRLDPITGLVLPTAPQVYEGNRIYEQSGGRKDGRSAEWHRRYPK